jgi:subtilisin
MVPWGIKKIAAPRLWKHSTGKGIRVAVVDTGIDYSHPDLYGRIGEGYNAIKPGWPPHDDNGHGTHMSGIIAACRAENGITGIAPEVTIYPIKAFDNQGSAYIRQIISSIDWCVYKKVHVINMSFGMKQRTSELQSALSRASRAGIIIVASSGNDGRRGWVDYPAKYKHVLSVGAHTKKGKISPFSNQSSSIDIYAPGESIRSCWLGGGYRSISGTSMATSHVSGVIALLLQQKPYLNYSSIAAALTNSSIPLVRQGKRIPAGRLDAVRAWRKLYRS